MKSLNNSIKKVFRLPRDKVGTHIYVDKGDYSILKVYKHVMKSTMTAVLHHMIGRASKCWEEKHDQQIADLNERVRTQAKIIVPYFGVLTIAMRRLE